MSILDIRKNEQKATEIKFDDTNDTLQSSGPSLIIVNNDKSAYPPTARILCDWDDFDNFIAACHKARELWGLTR